MNSNFDYNEMAYMLYTCDDGCNDGCLDGCNDGCDDG